MTKPCSPFLSHSRCSLFLLGGPPQYRKDVAEVPADGEVSAVVGVARTQFAGNAMNGSSMVARSVETGEESCEVLANGADPHRSLAEGDAVSGREWIVTQTYVCSVLPAHRVFFAVSNTSCALVVSEANWDDQQ